MKRRSFLGGLVALIAGAPLRKLERRLPQPKKLLASVTAGGPPAEVMTAAPSATYVFDRPTEHITLRWDGVTWQCDKSSTVIA